MWVKGICEFTDATVLSTHTDGWIAENSPIEAKNLVNWTHKKLKGKLARLDHELKPHYLQFYFRARRWIKKAIKNGEQFEIAHQINPVALRYPSPLSGIGLPYITGPHAGSLKTPFGMRGECKDKQLYRKLRNLDSLRLAWDPILKRSFANASLVLGVAPYVQKLLAPISLNQYENMAETGPSEIVEHKRTITPQDKALRLLFVGRIIRTKGIIDAIRAFAIATKQCNIQFEVIGEGDMLEVCKQEATTLGVSDKITFRGRIPREKVFDSYKESDVFLFPSFREPSGTVVFEALGFGLPLITCNNGGPGHVITEKCGIKVSPESPEIFAENLAKAIIELAHNRERVKTMSDNAIERVREVASWDSRLSKLESIYQNLASNR